MKRLIFACFLLAIPSMDTQAGFVTYLKSIPGIVKRVIAIGIANQAKEGITMVWNRFLRTRGLDAESMNADARAAGSASQNRLPEPVTIPVPIAEGTIPAIIQGRIDRLRRRDYSWPTCKPILLAGLPGSGKTQLGRYLAQRTSCPLVYESAAGIFAGVQNSGTEAIYSLFNRARRRPLLSSLAFSCRKLLAWICRRPQPVRKPAIILLDEFDAIGEPARADEVIAGDRPLEEERDKAFNRLLWEVARNPHKEIHPDKFPSWMNILPDDNIMKIIFNENMDFANRIPHYSCPPADFFEKTLATSLRGPALAGMFTIMQIEQLRRQGRHITPEQRREMETTTRRMFEAFAQFIPADSIIPLLHIVFEGHIVEEAIAHDETRGLRVPPRMHMIGRFHGWFAQKYHRFIYWMSAKDETDALVIATSNKRSEELDPRIHEFFEVIDMQPMTAEQRGHVLRFHAQGKHLATDVNLEGTAEDTEGFTGDELAAIVNNAALEAATQNHPEITFDDIDTAFAEQVERKERDRERVLV